MVRRGSEVVACGGALAVMALLGAAPSLGAPLSPTPNRAPDASGESSAEDWRHPPEAPAPEPEPERLSGAALKKVIPDLVTRPWPPPPQVTAGLWLQYPLQIGGLGVGFAAFPTSWLRLSAFYSIGGASNGKLTYISNYAEATVSFEVYGADSTTTKEVYKSAPKDYLEKPVPLLFVAEFPAHDSLLLEGGAITATMALQRCVAQCELEIGKRQWSESKRQLLYPFAGLHYMFNTDSSSKLRPLANQKAQIHLYGHVILRPLNDWDAARYWNRSHRVRRAPAGFRVGLDFPFVWRPAGLRMGITFGYLPSPGSVMGGFTYGW